MKRDIFTASMLIVMGLIFLSGCDSIIGPPESRDIDGAIRSMEYISQAAVIDPAQEIPDTPDDPDRPADGPGYIVKKYRHAKSFKELLILNPVRNIFWIGNIIDGNTITTGEYRPVLLERGPLTITISHPFIEGDVYREVEKAEYSLISNEIDSLRKALPDEIIVSNTDYDEHEVYSYEQTKIAAGAHFGFGSIFGSGSLDSMFDFEKQNIESRILIKLVEIYYSIGIDIKPASSYFDDTVTLIDIENELNGTTSPVIISEITYGRLGLVSIESRHDKETISTAFEAVYDSWFVNGEIDFESEYAKKLSESSIKTRIIGTGTTTTPHDLITFFEWITECRTHTINSPGEPLSYTLTYVKDGSVADIVLAGEYYAKKPVAGYGVYNGHTYQIVTYQRRWNEADSLCKTNGGHLGTITSIEEQSFIDKLNTTLTNNKGEYWIGGNRTPSTTVTPWRWITGEPWSYTHWASGQPDYIHGDIEDAVYVSYEDSGFWNDKNRSDIIDGYLCEWDYVIEPDPDMLFSK